ncbi:hypothetical protein DMX03_01745 [Pseudomonas koreensis]|nr:hypothetical protein DMX03_01745 [Pseudomonas koreensis]
MGASLLAKGPAETPLVSGALIVPTRSKGMPQPDAPRPLCRGRRASRAASPRRAWGRSFETSVD